MLGPAIECSLQISERGFSGGKILEKAYLMEETISIKRRKTHLDQKHTVKSVNLFHASFCHSKEDELNTRADPKGFSSGKRST